MRVPYSARVIENVYEKDYLKYNVCQGTPGAELAEPVPPLKDGSTSYIRLGGVGEDSEARIDVIFRTVGEYSPVWPVLLDSLENRNRDYDAGTVLKPGGYLNNGRKAGDHVAEDLIQINLCNERITKLESCFVDAADDPVSLTEATMRFFDIDHGKSANTGPEVMQFKCTGGTFTLYGFENETPGADGEFLLHMSASAKALERKDPDTLALRTVNGLPIHVYDCPVDEWVTLWSSRVGTQHDNPTQSVISVDDHAVTEPPNDSASTIGKEQERSMVQMDFAHSDCFEVIFGNMPPAYKTDPALIQRLTDGLELNTANYPDVGSGVCGYGTSGRNWLFGGVKGTAAKVCSTPPSPPPSPPRPVTVGNDPMMKVDGKFVKFSLPTGVLSPLLSWKTLQNGKAVKMELLGMTFTASKTCKHTLNCGGEGAASNATLVTALAQKAEQARVEAAAKANPAKKASPDMEDLTVHEAASMAIALAVLSPDQEPQWFGQLMLKVDNEPMLSVSRGEGGFGKMQVHVDGKLVKEGAEQVVSKRSGLRATLKRSKKHDWRAANVHSQVVAVEAPGFKFSIESAPGMKFSELAEQIKYAHLNLKFDEEAFPNFSNGFLAQLAGVRSLTERSEARFDVGPTHDTRRTGSAGLFDDPNGKYVGKDGKTSLYVPSPWR